VLLLNCLKLREFHKTTYGRPSTGLFIYINLKISAIVRFQFPDKAFTFVVTCKYANGHMLINFHLSGDTQ